MNEDKTRELEIIIIMIEAFVFVPTPTTQGEPKLADRHSFKRIMINARSNRYMPTLFNLFFNIVN